MLRDMVEKNTEMKCRVGIRKKKACFWGGED